MFTKTKSIGNSKYLQPKKLPVDLYDDEPPKLKDDTKIVSTQMEKVIYMKHFSQYIFNEIHLSSYITSMNLLRFCFIYTILNRIFPIIECSQN